MKQQVKLKRCAVAVTLALAASYPARAQEADDAAPLTRVVVTGSNIKRVDSETASPVQVLSHQEIVQSGAQTGAITIVFKEFGIRLKFTPTITEGGSIRLHVAPEVSSLDFANALTLNGFCTNACSGTPCLTMASPG